jgi:hypothetical protein
MFNRQNTDRPKNIKKFSNKNGKKSGFFAERED